MAKTRRNNTFGTIVLALVLGACSSLRSEPPPIIQYAVDEPGEKALVANAPYGERANTGVAGAPREERENAGVADTLQDKHENAGVAQAPDEDATRQEEVGIASWYGPRYHGRTTASGERFDMTRHTAAHRTLPFGTRVRVTNLENGHSVVVTINDRGPFVKGRIIDVSKHAAEHLGFRRQGTAHVRVRVGGPAGMKLATLLAPAATASPPARIITPPDPLECVSYARMASKVTIRGDAWTWWQSAEGHYRRGKEPALGSILVLKRTERLRLGHVSVVKSVVSDREVLVDHANWLNRGRIHQNIRVRDVSAHNDWSAVRVWYTPGNTFGRRTYLAHGFIHPK
ncbi:MAG: septal ring lytic transglycosylase RlpA family protein [Alphaproteobacteria bacterium]